jgi:hypothetical protein
MYDTVNANVLFVMAEMENVMLDHLLPMQNRPPDYDDFAHPGLALLGQI